MLLNIEIAVKIGSRLIESLQLLDSLRGVVRHKREWRHAISARRVRAVARASPQTSIHPGYSGTGLAIATRHCRSRSLPGEFRRATTVLSPDATDRTQADLETKDTQLSC